MYSNTVVNILKNNHIKTHISGVQIAKITRINNEWRRISVKIPPDILLYILYIQ